MGRRPSIPSWKKFIGPFWLKYVQQHSSLAFSHYSLSAALSFPPPNREEEFFVLESLPAKIFATVQPLHKLHWILKSHAMSSSGTTLFVIADYLSVKPRIVTRDEREWRVQPRQFRLHHWTCTNPSVTQKSLFYAPGIIRILLRESFQRPKGYLAHFTPSALGSSLEFQSFCLSELDNRSRRRGLQ